MEDIDRLDKRISDLEQHIAHQDAALQDLSEMTAQQWNVIDALTKKTERLMDRITAEEEAVATGSQQEPPPPHY